MTAKPRNTPAPTRPTDRDATPQGVTPAGAPPTEERTYEDVQDAAFDPRGDRSPDGDRSGKDSA